MMYRPLLCCLFLVLWSVPASALAQELVPTTPPEWRGSIDAERRGVMDANRIRTLFYNFGMVGDYQTNPDLTVFHSVEVPKGSGINYSDGITPFVLAKIRQDNGRIAYIMETGYRERQARSPITGRVMRFEPRPGYFEPSPAINEGRSIAVSNDPRTWPTGPTPEDCWIDKVDNPDDPGWCGSWNGYFGKQPRADLETFFVMDDQYYDAWDFYPDDRDRSRRGLALRVEVRGFQWSNPQAQNVIFWHYDIVNEGTTDYEDIVFGLYMDSGVGGAAVSCDGQAESDDDNALFDTSGFGGVQNLVYTWDTGGHGISLSSNCADTGYLGYAYLETPGEVDGVDNDGDGITDEQRDGGPGQKIEGREAIRSEAASRYNVAAFEREYGPIEERPAYLAGVWWTGDEDMDWVAEFNDTGGDGIFANDENPPDNGEKDGKPTAGEANFDQTDIKESDMIGLTGFKLNRIRCPQPPTDGIIFFTNQREWPRRLYEQFSSPDPDVRFDTEPVHDCNIGFLFASGPFSLEAGRRERFSLALAYGADLTALRKNVGTVKSIYDANYQFATPPALPQVNAYVGDGFVRLTWDTAAETTVDPVSNRIDFEGYRIYRSTDPNFLDPQVITNARGTGPVGNGQPIAQYDVINDFSGFSTQQVFGVAYWLGTNTGITHTFIDTTVTNGQRYYYAVTAYDHGSEKFNFYPSENAITVSRTPRSGTILPPNVVEVRPNPSVPGYVPASLSSEIKHVSGEGTAEVAVQVVNSALVPDGHKFRIDFNGFSDSVRATGYRLTDLTADSVLFEDGQDLAGLGTGPAGAGLKPIIKTPETVLVDTLHSGFLPESPTNAAFDVTYKPVLPINLQRPYFPANLIVTFSDHPLDTSRGAIGAPPIPTFFNVTTEEAGVELVVGFRDVDENNTLSQPEEFIDVFVPVEEGSNSVRGVWRITLDTSRIDGELVAPGPGDIYRLALIQPVDRNDAFTFTVEGERVVQDQAESQFEEQEPYVVPNPYIASASFEPQRFAVSGRGVRRIEFRAIPKGSTIRIYTVRGVLVRTLEHDGSTTGMVPWDLRTKDNLDVAPGLYIYHVDAGEVGEHVGKFAIIK